MATYYGQVFWTDQGNVPIPPDVVARFKNKTMAIVGCKKTCTSAHNAAELL